METVQPAQKDQYSNIKAETSDMNDRSYLDPGTSTFDPLRAIYDPEFQTDETTECHDNVEKCVAPSSKHSRCSKRH